MGAVAGLPHVMHWVACDWRANLHAGVSGIIADACDVL
jgi:hypothetical protein